MGGICITSTKVSLCGMGNTDQNEEFNAELMKINHY